METPIILLFEASGVFAILLSLLMNIFIGILGIVPSVFLTAANLLFFGFELGVLISILGEALGAIISFILYRKGINKFIKSKYLASHSMLTRLEKSKGAEAFGLIIALRIFPFVPSGIVTLASAWSMVGMLNFAAASTIGKIPALLIEAYSIQQILEWNWKGQLILCIIALFLLIILFKKKRNT